MVVKRPLMLPSNLLFDESIFSTKNHINEVGRVYGPLLRDNAQWDHEGGDLPIISWKSFASDQNIFIYGKPYITLFYTRYLMY